MRKGGNTLSVLKQAGAVRRAQRLAAEMAAGRAAQAHREAEARVRASAAQLERDHQGWAEALSATRPSLDLALLWSAEISRSETALRQANAAAARAAKEKAARAEALGAARAREEVTEDVTERLSRRMRRLREEALLNDMADRAAQKEAAQ